MSERMNKSLAKIIEEKDKIIDEIMIELRYKDKVIKNKDKEIKRLKYYENLIKEIKDDVNKDCWGI